MDVFDGIVIVVAVAAAVGGFRLGFFARVVSWVGLGIGIVLAARLLPNVISAFINANPVGKLIVAALVLLGGAFIGQAIGLVIGTHIGKFIPIGPLRAVDDVAGAAIGLLGVFVFVWLLLPSMANVSGWPARQARNSTIARFVDRDFPSPPKPLDALRQLVGDNTFPEVFSELAPAQNAGPPPADSGIAAALQARIAQSTVKVEGVACGRIQEGSGWAIDTDLIVTNAHVVAGEKHTTVMRPDGHVLAATVIAFDESIDLALLSVPHLAEPSLPVMAVPASGAAAAEDKLVGSRGAVFGHPGGQNPLAVTPSQISQFVEAIGRDLYDEHNIKRDVFILAANIMPGDSGGPLVNQAGTVVGVAFAIAPDRPGTSYALSFTELDSFIAAGSTGPVGTGPCVND